MMPGGIERIPDSGNFSGTPCVRVSGRTSVAHKTRLVPFLSAIVTFALA